MTRGGCEQAVELAVHAPLVVAVDDAAQLLRWLAQFQATALAFAATLTPLAQIEASEARPQPYKLKLEASTRVRFFKAFLNIHTAALLRKTRGLPLRACLVQVQSVTARLGAAEVVLRRGHCEAASSEQCEQASNTSCF